MKAGREKIPVKRGVQLIGGTLLLVWGVIFLANFLHEKSLAMKQADSKYLINRIVSKTAGEELPKGVLADILGLSRKQRPNLFAVTPEAYQKRLEQAAVFSHISVRRLPPSTLVIDYQLRQPAALLGEFANIACDERGYMFPFTPYYRPKDLPTVTLGEPIRQKLENRELFWLKPLSGTEWEAFLAIKHWADAPLRKLISVDLSRMSLPTRGARSVHCNVVETRFVDGKPLFLQRSLRLNAEAIHETLAIYDSIYGELDRLQLDHLQDGAPSPMSINMRPKGFISIGFSSLPR